MSGGHVFADYIDETENAFSNKKVIAHNLKFDENFMSVEMFRLNRTFKPAARFDTMDYFTDICRLPKT